MPRYEQSIQGTDESIDYYNPPFNNKPIFKSHYNIDDGFFMPKPNVSVSRRSSILNKPKKIFHKFRETIQEHLSFDKILNKQMEALDRFLEESKLLPIGIRGPKISLLPDLSVLRQLFHSGRQNVRSTAVCRACRVGFALFLFKVWNCDFRLVVKFCIFLKIVFTCSRDSILHLFHPFFRLPGRKGAKEGG